MTTFTEQVGVLQYQIFDGDDGYGIKIIKNEEESIVSGISFNFEVVKELAEMLVRNTLEPCHLHDVVEDFVSQW